MPSKTWQLSPPKLTAIDSSLPHPSPSSPVYAPSTSDCNNDSAIISSPEKSTATPFPASCISSAKLAQLIKQSDQGSVSAGSRRPLILDLRPHPDFYPLSIAHSININLPTLLMRRYRRGGAISSFALESFITMPSDKDAGDEAYGRSATAAWTLLNVLERGIGSDCFGGAPIRLWYLEGGFAAFQSWDFSEKYLMRSGFLKSSTSNFDSAEQDEIHDDSEDKISCILPNFLYLGPEIVHQSQVEELDRLGVKRILNMATECEDLLVSNRQGMEYHKIGVYDHIDADVSAGLQEAVDIIGTYTFYSPIYVHCKAGKSRSVTATIAYLITQLQWPLNKAYKHVLTQRPCMCPNIGFVSELIRMEERTFGADKARGIYVA
ncbi:protein-tyrosine phosphatase-like protein [Dissophora ornata]|nr:protein-tyrosine phosphatase-like protein [Dissophora ornata]